MVLICRYYKLTHQNPFMTGFCEHYRENVFRSNCAECAKADICIPVPEDIPDDRLAAIFSDPLKIIEFNKHHFFPRDSQF